MNRLNYYFLRSKYAIDDTDDLIELSESDLKSIDIDTASSSTFNNSYDNVEKSKNPDSTSIVLDPHLDKMLEKLFGKDFEEKMQFLVTGLRTDAFADQKITFRFTHPIHGNVEVDLGYVRDVLNLDAKHQIQQLLKDIRKLLDSKELENKTERLLGYKPKGYHVFTRAFNIPNKLNYLGVGVYVVPILPNGKKGPTIYSDVGVIGKFPAVLSDRARNLVIKMISKPQLSVNDVVDEFKSLIQPEGMVQDIPKSDFRFSFYCDSSDNLYIIYNIYKYKIGNLQDFAIYNDHTRRIIERAKNYLLAYKARLNRSDVGNLLVRISAVDYGGHIERYVIYLNVYLQVYDEEKATFVYKTITREPIRLGSLYACLNDELKALVDNFKKIVFGSDLKEDDKHKLLKSDVKKDNVSLVDPYLEFEPKKIIVDSDNILYYNGVSIGPLISYVKPEGLNIWSEHLLTAREKVGLHLEIAADPYLKSLMRDGLILFLQEAYPKGLPEDELTGTQKLLKIPTRAEKNVEISHVPRYDIGEQKTITYTVFFVHILEDLKISVCISAIYGLGAKSARGMKIVNGLVDRSVLVDKNVTRAFESLGPLDAFLYLDKILKVYKDKSRTYVKDRSR